MSKIMQVCLLAGILFFVGGCATCNDCGTIREKHAVTNIFYDYEIIPGYNYFYNGTMFEPNAILAVDQSYTLEGKFWTPIDITKEQLRHWVLNGRRSGADANGSSFYQGRFQGAEILDPQGHKVGVWYSKYGWGLFKFPGDKVIIAYPPAVRPGFEFSRKFINDD